MSWTWNAPSGVYTNNALSSKIREQAAADALFARFVSPETGYGKKRGGSITITRIQQLPLANRVSELDRLPTGRPAMDTKTVVPSEWGFRCEMTEFEENLTHFDLRNRFQRMLRDQMRLTTDKMIADVMKLSPVKFTPHQTGGVDDSAFDTDGTPSVTANRNMGVTHLRQIHDYMRSTLKAPAFRNGQYVGILSTKAARGIKNDPEYKDWLAPTTAEPFTKGMLKSIEGFDLYETNHTDALLETLGTASVLGEAVFFGDDQAFLAVVQDPELRAGVPQDLGRFRDVGWVGTLDAGLTWDTAALARVVHVASA